MNSSPALTTLPDCLTTLFLDLNSYFASVEQNERPSLRGKPVVVVPMETDGTCAIAASPEAKAFGIKTGTKIYDAKKICPQLVCVLARHDLYVQYHHRIKEAAAQHLPVAKTWSIDEFHCELIGREREPARARDLARRIKQQIWDDVGPAMNCSIGISSNSFLAKTATDLQKRNGLVILHPDDLPGPLLSLELRDLPGINTRMEQRLFRAGVDTIEKLWHTSPKQARAIWGSVSGERFWYWLRGYDLPQQETNASMIGHSRVLDLDMRSPDRARLMARRLLFKAIMRMRRRDFCAGALSLSVKLTDGRRWGGDLRFTCAHDVFTFMQHLDDLWSKMALDSFGKLPEDLSQRPLLSKVSIILHDLQLKGRMTGDLFTTELAENNVRLARQESLSAAMEKLNQKYRGNAISLGTIPKTLAGHVGTKIAFSRVPDLEEFME